MNYSQYYEKWFERELSKSEAPTYYEFLGLADGEPDTQKISQALEKTLDKFQMVNGRECPEVYGFFAHQILSCRRTLLNSELKSEYDLRILGDSALSVRNSNRRVTLGERLRQFAFIGIAFALGCVIMVAMALMVERNPDGSIAFHEEVKAAKAKPFETPVGDIIYRPKAALDFREDGYAAVWEKQVGTAVGAETNSAAELAESAADSSDSLDLKGLAEEIEENAAEGNSENGLNAILPDGNVGEEALEIADSQKDSAEKKVSSGASLRRSRRINPLYERIRKQKEAEKAAEENEVFAQRKTEETAAEGEAKETGDSELAAAETKMESETDTESAKDSGKTGLAAKLEKEKTELANALADTDMKADGKSAGKEPGKGSDEEAELMVSVDSGKANGKIDGKMVSKTDGQDEKTDGKSGVRIASAEPGSQTDKSSGKIGDELEKSQANTGDSGKTKLVKNAEGLKEASAAAEKVLDKTFSFKEMLEMLDNIYVNLEEKNPKLRGVVVSFQGQVCLEIIQKYHKETKKLDAQSAHDLMEYVLTSATDLAWSKQFDEAYQLCIKLYQLGTHVSFAPEWQKTIQEQYDTIKKYEVQYQKAQKTYAALQNDPTNPELNTLYAVWLWQETGDLKDSIPYLAKCQFQRICRAAQFEMRMAEEKKLQTPQYVLALADLWWDIAVSVQNETQAALVREHAAELYQKVDSRMLSKQQKLRAAGELSALK